MKTISLKLKILSLCILLSSVSFVVGGLSYTSLKDVQYNYDHVTMTNLPNMMALNEMLLNFRLIRLELGLMGLPNTSKRQIDDSSTRIKIAMDAYEMAKNKYLGAEYAPGIPFGPGETELFEAVEKKWISFKETERKAEILIHSPVATEREQFLEMLTSTLYVSAEEYAKSSAELKAWNENQAVEWVGKATASAEASNRMVILVVLAGAAASLVLGVWFAYSVSKSVADIVINLKAGADQVLQASHQIASASIQLSQSTTEQASALEETAASIEEMNSMISRNAESAGTAETTSSQSHARVLQGKSIVEKMNVAMADIGHSNDAIAAQVNKSNESVAGIIKVMEQIDKETKVIDEIVNKTELLSFNASVEAARAGDHGKGFAVVAEEVGNLARMSGSAAEKIKVMLEESVSKVEQIVRETKSSVDKLVSEGKSTVDRGTQIAQECGSVFEQVIADVGAVATMAADIAGASQEQAKGSSEITKAVGQLDQMTQQNATASEQCASAAEQLSAQAESMTTAVQSLAVTINGGSLSDNRSGRPHEESGRSAEPSKRKTNVIDFRKRTTAKSSETLRDLKKVANSVPSYSDRNFTDV